MIEQKATHSGSGKLGLSEGPQAEYSLARTCSLGPQTTQILKLKGSIHFDSFSAATEPEPKIGKKEEDWERLLIRCNRSRHRKRDPGAPEQSSVCTHGVGKPRMAATWI